MADATRALRAADGARADIPGLGSRYLVRGTETGGRFAVIEHLVPPHRLAAPLHTHEHEDEFSYVLSGRIGVQIGDEIVDLGPGDSLFKPRGVPHAFWNAGDTEASLTETIAPASFDQYFTDLVPAFSGTAPDFAAMAALQSRYGLAMDLESIPRLCRAYHLEP